MLNYDSLSKSPYYCSQVIKTQFKAEDVLNAAAPAQHAEGRGSIPSTICGLLYIFEVEMQQVCSKRAKLSDSWFGTANAWVTLGFDYPTQW